jgi:hypothetical protein
MFIGHYAVGLAAKKAFPKTSLGTYFLAVQWLDIVWPLFLLLGWEHARITPGITQVMPLDLYDMPFSHSLVAALIWSLLFYAFYFLIRRSHKGAIILSACVLSHWVLDVIAHRPDMPLTLTGNSRLGLGLWNSVLGTLFVETGMFVIGLLLYVNATKPRNNLGKYSLWGLTGLLILIYSMQFTGVIPPDMRSVAILGNTQWIIIFLAYWVNQQRKNVAIKCQFFR